MKKLLASFFGSPILWGGAVSFGFYALLRRGVIQNDLVIRYATGHPIEYITLTLFFIGMVSLFFKYLKIGWGKHSLRLGPIFPPVRAEKESVSAADAYLETLKRARTIRGETLHIGRLRRALLFLKSSGRADELDQELRYLADEDAMAVESDYGMVRMFIWAIPILGFLGTVIGITAALGNLDLTKLETTSKLLSDGLNVAFDTTALALSLVFLLYFSLFFVQRAESALFARVDRLVSRELKGRFIPSPSPLEQEELKASRKILKSMVETFDAVMKRQTEIWESAMAETVEQGRRAIQSGADQIQEGLRSSLSESVSQHAQLLVQGEESFIRETMTPWSESMKENAEKMVSLQNQMVEEGNTFREILHATGEITKLEDRLNQNLASLADSRDFREVVDSLTDAVYHLNERICAVIPLDSRRSDLLDKPRESFPRSRRDYSTSRNWDDPLSSDSDYENREDSRDFGRQEPRESKSRDRSEKKEGYRLANNNNFSFPLSPPREKRRDGFFKSKKKSA